MYANSHIKNGSSQYEEKREWFEYVFFYSVEDSAEICWEPRAFSALPTVQHSGALPSRLSLISLPDSYTLPTEINNTYWWILSLFFKGNGRKSNKNNNNFIFLFQLYRFKGVL